MNVVTDIVDS